MYIRMYLNDLNLIIIHVHIRIAVQSILSRSNNTDVSVYITTDQMQYSQYEHITCMLHDA